MDSPGTIDARRGRSDGPTVKQGMRQTDMKKSNLEVGQWVEVRSKQEILRTLDKNACLDGMPFMPEMFAWCGQRFRVVKSAHKTCDTVFPVRGRSLNDSVHLGTRCDGSAHGGCQAGCLIFWKSAWLKPAAAPGHHGASVSLPVPSVSTVVEGAQATVCTESDVRRAARMPQDGDADPTYVCQATRLPYFTSDLNPFDPRQYVTDLSSGNVDLGKWIRGVIYITYRNLINLGIGLGRPLRWLYDRFQALVGGIAYPRHPGLIPMGQATPTAELNLQEGDWVKIKSYRDILATCNEENKNRGLFFDAEQVPYCGGTYRVHKRVTQILNEQTGKMMQMKNPCIVLEDVYCRSRYSDCRMFCPRGIYSYWREIWLERAPSPLQSDSRLSEPSLLNHWHP